MLLDIYKSLLLVTLAISFTLNGMSYDFYEKTLTAWKSGQQEENGKKILDYLDTLYPTEPERAFKEFDDKRRRQFKETIQMFSDCVSGSYVKIFTGFYAKNIYKGEFSPLEYQVLVDTKFNEIVRIEPPLWKEALKRIPEAEKVWYMRRLFLAAQNCYEYGILEDLIKEYAVPSDFMAVVLFNPLVMPHFQDDPLLKEIYQGTPLHFAAREVNKELVDFLLSHGADPLIRDSQGKSPRDIIEDNLSDGSIALCQQRHGSRKLYEERCERVLQLLPKPSKIDSVIGQWELV